MYYIYSLLTLILTVHNVFTQQGVFAPYNETNGDTVIDSTTTTFVSTATGTVSGAAQADNPKSVEWILGQSFKMFGQDISTLRIFESGVVSINGGELPSCQSTDATLSTSYIAPFWIRTDITKPTSRIYYRMEEMNDASTMTGSVNYTALVDEVNQARMLLTAPDNVTITVADVTTAIFITWYNMKPVQSDLVNPGYKLSFQLVILSTATRSYTLIVYRHLDFHILHYTDFNCPVQALAGLHYTGSQKYHFELSNFFYLTASKLLYHTNIQKNTILGRYSLILDFVATQPTPPKLNCAVPFQDQDPFCYLGISPNYCEGKPVGWYPHPTFCDRLVACGQGDVTQVHQCPQWTAYNPWIQNCDYIGYYRCLFIQRGQIGLAVGQMAASIRGSQGGGLGTFEMDGYNTLLLAAHNNTCAGLSKPGNIVDIISCEHFISCSNSRSIRRKCPHYLMYNPSKDQCDYKYNVQCVNGTRPTLNATTTISTTTTIAPNTTTTIAPNTTTTPTLVVTTRPFSNTSCDGVIDGNAADPQSCSRFLVCKNGEPTHRMHCSPGTFFNREIRVCDHRRNVDCVNGQRPPLNGRTIPTEPPAETYTTPVPFNLHEVCVINVLPYGNGYAPDPRSCKNYFRCDRWTVFEYLVCGDGLFYNTYRQQCVPQQQSDCPNLV